MLGFNLIGDGLREAWIQGSGAVARQPLLVVEDLKVEFWTARGTIYAVNGISFDIAPGETLGIVGESGCGKRRDLARAARDPRAAGRVTSGNARRESRPPEALRRGATRIRGREIAMIFQDPMTSLNPVLTIGRQIREVLETHFGMDKDQADDRAAELLATGRHPEGAGRSATTRTSSPAGCASGR